MSRGTQTIGGVNVIPLQGDTKSMKPPKPPKPTVASLAEQVAELKGTIEDLRGSILTVLAYKEQHAVADLSTSPVALIMIYRNTVETVYSNVPGLRVVVHDADVIEVERLRKPRSQRCERVANTE